MEIKKLTVGLSIAVVVVGVFLAGLAIGERSTNPSNPGKGKGKIAKEKVYTFAGSAQLLSVDPENRSLTIFVDAGSYTTMDFKFRQRNAVIDEGVEIFIGDNETNLEDISGFERAYIFGRQIDNEIHINKILVPVTQTSD